MGAVMGRMPTCVMFQNWLPMPDRELRPGSVAVAHYDHDLIVYAELTDEDIFNPVKANGVEAFKWGDVIEIFLREENEDRYLEHHITPDNYVLQLHWPNVETVRKLVDDLNRGKQVDYVAQYSSHIPVRSQTIVQPDLSVWRVLAIIPLNLLAAKSWETSRNWSFSFSRYDYTRSRKDPVLSSTSALQAPNFHELTSWGTLSLA